jgi:predicted ATPase
MKPSIAAWLAQLNFERYLDAFVSADAPPINGAILRSRGFDGSGRTTWSRRSSRRYRRLSRGKCVGRAGSPRGTWQLRRASSGANSKRVYCVQPIREFVERAAGISFVDDTGSQLLKLAALCARSPLASVETVDALASLIALPVADDLPHIYPLTTDQRKELVFRTLLDQLAAIAERGSVCIVAEDLHWADPTTLELLTRAIDKASAACHLLRNAPQRFQVRLPRAPQNARRSPPQSAREIAAVSGVVASCDEHRE